MRDRAIELPANSRYYSDLDSFKRVNDQYGHLVGDTVLRECASRIATATRPIDAIGRYGGEELLLLMPGLSMGSIKPRIEEIRKAIGDKFFATAMSN